MGTGMRITLVSAAAVAGLTVLRGSFGGNGLLEGTALPEQVTRADFTRAHQTRLEADAQEAVRASLGGTASPLFRNLRVIGPRSGFTSVCGEVSTQPSGTRFTSFIVSYADKVGQVLRANVTLASGQSGTFQSTWHRDCT